MQSPLAQAIANVRTAQEGLIDYVTHTIERRVRAGKMHREGKTPQEIIDILNAEEEALIKAVGDAQTHLEEALVLDVANRLYEQEKRTQTYPHPLSHFAPLAAEIVARYNLTPKEDA
jgi:hypothetical protein